MSAAKNSSNNDVPIARAAFDKSRTFLLLVCSAIGLAIGFLYLGPLVPNTPEGGTAPERGSSSTIPPQKNVVQPNKSLTPEQVVAAQMKALVQYRTDRSAIHQVFAFASPANRAVTGPIDKFEAMIRQESYFAMVESEHWMAGRAVNRDGQATVLVTSVDADEEVSLYRFYLSKQSDSHEDCWMTDHVLRIDRPSPHASAGNEELREI